jgi:ATP-dependent DNA helicase RecQ
MADDALNVLQQVLAAPAPDYTAARSAIGNTRRTGRDQILAATAVRLLNALAGLDRGEAGVADVTALLRQLIRWSGPLRLWPALWRMLVQEAEHAGMVGNPGDDGLIEVTAAEWRARWLAGSEVIDTLELRRDDEREPGDGMLLGMSQAARVDWDTYQSGAQKAGVDCWTFAAPGSTTLVTLPTGGGKSLCSLLPPWFASRGGRHSQGTTLVVVPTVGLALDQERQAQKFFPDAVGEFSRPISRTGDTTPEDRLRIEAALRDGRLPLIYTSPESLLGSRLYDVCLDAARAGLLTRFVIDEAHLIASWGAGFRPEFQLLAAYRRRLLKESGGRLRTLLLSATVPESGRNLIESHFAEPGKLTFVQANRLRPEIGYWFNFTNSGYVRQQRVLEALRYLPRPLILYVTRPDQAREWLGRLHERGYRRVAQFTGETGQDERRRLLQAWDENRIDVMVATSAFGLGVDKADVRSIVHATLPENVDRYYQEVGRGGRDGYASISLVCATEDANKEYSDVKLAYGLQEKIITIEKGLPRWLGMLDTAVFDDDVLWVNRDAGPVGHPGMAGSERNREWNDHLLLLMQRAGLIQVADAPPPRQVEGSSMLYRVPIRILDPEVRNNPEETLQRIQPYREQERDRAMHAVQGIIKLVSDYSRDEEEECLSCRFGQVYENVQFACGGCPPCRKTNQRPYSAPLEFTVEHPLAWRRQVAPTAPLDPTLESRLGAWRSLTATWDGPRTRSTLASFAEPLLPVLVNAGLQQVIYPVGLLDDNALRRRILSLLAEPGALQQPVQHRLVSDAWVVQGHYPLFPLATLIIYPPDDRGADRLWRALNRAEQEGIRFPATVHVIHASLAPATLGGQFTQKVDGLAEPAERLLALLRREQETPDFF